MGQVKWIINIIFVALFSIAILGFAVGFANDNEASISIADDPDFVTIQSGQKDDINSLLADADTSTDALFSSTIESGDETVATGGQFKVGFSTGKKIVETSINAAFIKIFGRDTEFGFIFSAITALVSIIGGYYIWKTWRGNPD